MKFPGWIGSASSMGLGRQKGDSGSKERKGREVKRLTMKPKSYFSMDPAWGCWVYIAKKKWNSVQPGNKPPRSILG
jgi:hypothetical protein